MPQEVSSELQRARLPQAQRAGSLPVRCQQQVSAQQQVQRLARQARRAVQLLVQWAL